ncbi:hypothetical protein ACXR0O_14685 [Verrucomicrobiota bacterium sgz303538]
MSKQLRRFEILLPLRFNDGQPVPRELLEQTRAELKYEFGGLSSESQVIQGFDRDTTGEDTMVRLFADVPNTPESMAFFLKAKARLKERFQQEDIWITTHVVEVV